MAPDAKLVLIDHTIPTAAGSQIVTPPGNQTFAFDWALSMGAKIHSASWGGYGAFPQYLAPHLSLSLSAP
jgi:hypothetical protein